MKKTWSKLSKADKKHLRDNKIYTKWQFEEQIEFMKKEMKKQSKHPIICWDCIKIAKKLGMW